MLRIRKLTDYGIMILTRMAQSPKNQVFAASDIANEVSLPLPTVTKILKILMKGNLLTSQRGINGGYFLSIDPKAISVADIIVSFEGPLAITECTDTIPGVCQLEPFCQVKSHWHKINETLFRALQNLSLADMVRPVSMNSVNKESLARMRR